MQISFLGANCFKVKINNSNLVFDDNLKSLGLKSISQNSDIVCMTNDYLMEFDGAFKHIFNMPGSYEVEGILINGIEANSFMDADNQKQATIYKVITQDLNLVITGHIQADLNDHQLEQIGDVDILIIPVGGGGYTLDSVGATEVVKILDPRIVIPSHYQQSKVKYSVPQTSYNDFVQQLGVEAEKVVNPFKVKRSDLMDKLRLLILEN